MFFTIAMVFHVKKHTWLIKLFPPPNHSNSIDSCIVFCCVLWVLFSCSACIPVFYLFLFQLSFLCGLCRPHHLSERKRSFVFFLPQDFAS